jgi:hypothetical protein
MIEWTRHEEMLAHLRADAAERQAQRELGLQIIAIGSRALMKEAHPKLASSRKTVAMIRRVRARLKAAMSGGGR